MEQIRSAAMANLLGQHVPTNQNQYRQLMAYPTVKLHSYGKAVANIDRKMGHLTATAETPELAESYVREARQALLDLATDAESQKTHSV